MEAAKIEGGFARALEHAVDMTGTPVLPQSWGRAEVATDAKFARFDGRRVRKERRRGVWNAEH